MKYKNILAAALFLGTASGAWATTVTTTDTTSVADTLVCEAGTGGITTKKCSPAITSSQILTTTDTSSVADTLMCEAGTGGITGKKCAGPITASQVVTTTGSSSVGGNLACMDGVTGKAIIDCGFAAVTTIAAYGMYANNTASAANPTVLTPTGSYGVPVLNDGVPIFNGGQIGFYNTSDSANPSRITLRNVAPTVGGSSVSYQTEFKNSAAAYINSGSLKLYSDTLTAGGEYSHWLLQTIQNNAASNELSAGGGVGIGSPSALKGVGTLVAEKGIWPGTGTVATLPTCNAGAKGQIRFVTDANSTTFNATAAGSGSNAMLSLCDGSLWKIR